MKLAPRATHRIEERHSGLKAKMGRVESGFTLLELLVVVAIVSVLMAFAYHVYDRTVEAARASACTSNLRQIGVALNIYLAENSMTMPPLQNRSSSIDPSQRDVPAIDNTLNKYLPNPAVFACPADNQNLARTSGTSYYWNTALNNQRIGSLSFLNLTDDQSRIPIIADKVGFHPYLNDKVNILYADGHATKDLQFWKPQ
jgi:prepilin-type N-terminal cleavage/methylation domain-containing protein/prepilin-type processing-associated H-X9-DG protein